MALFKDKELDAQFEKDGFVIVDFLSENDIIKLTELYHSLPAIEHNGFFSSMRIANEKYKNGIA
jgi:hypothetical protein